MPQSIERNRVQCSGIRGAGDDMPGGIELGEKRAFDHVPVAVEPRPNECGEPEARNLLI